MLELGEPAIRYLTEIVHRRPRQWYEDVDRLHAVLQSHGPEVLRRAMEAGLQQQVFGALYVERSLQSGLNFPEVVQGKRKTARSGKPGVRLCIRRYGKSTNRGMLEVDRIGDRRS